MENVKVDGKRLWDSMMTMAEIGATPKGGVNRLTLTDLDRQSRDLFKRWCEEAGMTVSVDRLGNMFCRRPGRRDDLPPVLAGSHLDSQPTGGKFDGAYGVLAALELVRTLNDLGYETEAPIEIVNWTNEEGSRFSPAMMGSGAYVGAFTEDEILAKTDRDGAVFGDELARIGYAGDMPLAGRPLDSYFEAHIEQGPVLENADIPVGIVTGGQGQRWFEVTVRGRESHAGPTPMPLRRDALVAAARMIDAVNRIGHAHPPHACATVGLIDSRPNSRNVIPGEVFFTVDFRHPEEDVLAAMDAELKAAVADCAASAQCDAEVTDFWAFPPQPFDPACIQHVRDGAARAGVPSMELFSGAGHDAVYMARVCPTAMIFVPCKDGISHNEAEDAKPADCEAGANVLLHAVLARANAPKA